jgi:hypothetical protein
LVVVDFSRMKTETVNFSTQLCDGDDIATQWVRLSSKHKISNSGHLYIHSAGKLRGGQPYVDLLNIEIYDFDKRVKIDVFGRTAGGVYTFPWTEIPANAEHVYEQLAHGLNGAPRIARRNYKLIIETWNAFIDILTGTPPSMEQMHEEYDYNK